METKKQTSVEWLEIQLKKGVDINPLDLVSYTKAVDKLFEEAKEKEKEQIIEAIDYGCSDWGSFKDVEKYYNETYNK